MLRCAWIFFICSVVSAQVPLKEDVQVVLRDLRVHVLDDKGQPVRGLSQDDFIVFEADAPQRVQYFEEVDFLNPNVENDPLSHHDEIRRWVFVLDSANMSPGAFDEAVAAIRALVDDVDLSRIAIKLVQIENQMEHLTDFSQNRETLTDALRTALHEGRLWQALNMIERDTVDAITSPLSIDHAAVASTVQANLQRKASLKSRYYQSFYANMRGLATLLAPMPGSKSVFLLSGGSFVEVEGFYLGSNRLATGLAKIFNQADTTIYSALRLPSIATAERFMNRATRPLPPDLSYRSLSRATNFPPGESVPEQTRNTVFENNEQPTTGPRFAAEGTGGLFRKGASTDLFARELPRLRRISDHYYRLHYTRLSEDMGKESQVRVQLAKPRRDWQLVYGTTYDNRDDFADLDEDERQLTREVTLLYGEDWRNDLDVTWQFQVFRGRVGGFRIPVSIDVPGGWQVGEGGLDLVILAFNEAGAVVDRLAATLDKLDGTNPLLLYDVVVTEELPTRIKIYLRNTQSGAYVLDERGMDAAPDDMVGPHMSGIALSRARPVVVLALNDLRDSKETRDLLRQQEDPFALPGQRFVPQPEMQFGQGKPIFFFLRVRKLRFPDGQFPMTLYLMHNGEKLSAKSRLLANMPMTEGVAILGAFETAHLESGEYRLVMRLTHPQRGEALSRTRQFELTP